MSMSEASRTLLECGPACAKVETRPGSIKAALHIVGDKWTPFMIGRLVSSPRTFSELEDLLPGISPRTLSARLDKLEREGIISKTEYASRPIRYRYMLTTKGEELTTIITHMALWGERHG
jgi:DNA-binding HxlR family transcriptional regulator